MGTRLLIALLFTASLLAQEPKSPAAAPSPPIVTVAPTAPAFSVPVQSRCSIPLIPMQIPKGIEFKLREIQPKTQSIAPMLEGKLPAPPCTLAPLTSPPPK